MLQLYLHFLLLQCNESFFGVWLPSISWIERKINSDCFIFKRTIFYQLCISKRELASLKTSDDRESKWTEKGQCENEALHLDLKSMEHILFVTSAQILEDLKLLKYSVCTELRNCFGSLVTWTLHSFLIRDLQGKPSVQQVVQRNVSYQ